MGIRVYLPVAVVVFLAATTGADLVARTSIADQPFAAALNEHLYWAREDFIGTMLLLAPFTAVAFVCAFVEKHARTRSALAIFALGMLTLLYVYFQGYQAAERAELQKMWTAAALSIGFLPFVGLTVVIAAMGAGALAAKLDRQISV